MRDALAGNVTSFSFAPFVTSVSLDHALGPRFVRVIWLRSSTLLDDTLPALPRPLPSLSNRALCAPVYLLVSVIRFVKPSFAARVPEDRGPPAANTWSCTRETPSPALGYSLAAGKGIGMREPSVVR